MLHICKADQPSNRLKTFTFLLWLLCQWPQCFFKDMRPTLILSVMVQCSTFVQWPADVHVGLTPCFSELWKDVGPQRLSTLLLRPAWHLAMR